MNTVSPTFSESIRLPKEQKVLLIVDDEHLFTHAFVELLRSEGYAAFGATSAHEAFNILAHIPIPNLILVDCMMPVVSGEDFVRTLEDHWPDVYRNSRIVGLSGLPAGSSVSEGFEEVIHFFEVKPVDINDWLNLVARHSEKPVTTH